MSEFKLFGYEFKTNLNINGLQNHLEEFEILLKLLGYTVISKREGPDVNFSLDNGENKFSILLERIPKSHMVFNIVFRSLSFRNTFVDKYGYCYFQGDDTERVVEILKRYKDVI